MLVVCSPLTHLFTIFFLSCCLPLHWWHQFLIKLEGQVFLGWITYVGLFMTVSSRWYHSTVPQIPPLSVWSFQSSLSVSYPMHFRLLLPLHLIVSLVTCVTSLPFCLHLFFHPYIIFSSLLQNIYLHLSLFSLFVITPSPFISLPIFSHLTVPIHQDPLLHTSLSHCIVYGASERRVSPPWT